MRADYLRALRDAASYRNPTAGEARDRKQLGRQHGSEYQFCGDQRQDELQQLWRQAQSWCLARCEAPAIMVPLRAVSSGRTNAPEWERSMLTYSRFRQLPTAAIAEAKARQSRKIRELRTALRSAGLIGLDDQARALGLPRSTTWKILKGDHQASGLSAMVVSRMLSEPRLPPAVRTKILEYVREKIDGLYGHGKRELLIFSARIGIPKTPSANAA